MKALKLGLWAATLFVVSWALTLISAVVASKGGVQRTPALDTGAGVVDDAPPLYPNAGEMWP